MTKPALGESINVLLQPVQRLLAEGPELARTRLDTGATDCTRFALLAARPHWAVPKGKREQKLGGRWEGGSSALNPVPMPDPPLTIVLPAPAKGGLR